MLAGIHKILDHVKRHLAEESQSPKQLALSASFDRTIIKTYQDILKDYIGKPAKSASTNIDLARGLGDHAYFEASPLKQEIADKLFPHGTEQPELLKKVMDELSELVRLAEDDSELMELLLELTTRDIQANARKYIFHFLVLHRLAMKITSLSKADTVCGIVQQLTSLKSFEESGLLPFIELAQNKLIEAIVQANLALKEQSRAIEAHLESQTQNAAKACHAVLSNKAAELKKDFEGKALESLPEIKAAYEHYQEQCRQYQSAEKEKETAQAALDQLNEEFLLTLSLCGEEAKKRRAELSPLNSPQRAKAREKRELLSQARTQKTLALANLQTQIEALPPEKKLIAQSLLDLANSAALSLEAAVCIIETTVTDPSELKRTYFTLIAECQKILPDICITAQFSDLGTLSDISIAPVAMREERPARGGAGSPSSGAEASPAAKSMETNVYNGVFAHWPMPAPSPLNTPKPGQPVMQPLS